MDSVSFVYTTKKGTRVLKKVNVEYVDGRIEFLNLPFSMKDEVKACMRGAKWHGHIDGRKIWSVDDCYRNRFQLELLSGGNPYANWERPRIEHEYQRPLMMHQTWMSDFFLTYHYGILAADMGTGKSLSMIEGMERSGHTDWWFVAPKSGLRAVELEFEKWSLNFQPTLMTYEKHRRIVQEWEPGTPVPQGVIYDEFSRCKSARAQRSQAAQDMADKIRAAWGWDGYVIGASGSPAPKSPVDWWMLAEIVAPGFLREADPKKFEWRLRIFEKKDLKEQGIFHVPAAWRDDEKKCDRCGGYEDEHDMLSGDHPWEPSKNEVAYLSKRLEGLIMVLRKEDCLDLPGVTHREIILQPNPTIKRAARALANSATSTIQALTWLRTLSDGFQYEIEETDELVKCKVCKGSGEYKDWEPDGDIDNPEVDWKRTTSICEHCGGEGHVPKSMRTAHYFKGPKEQALMDLLDECDEHGRIVIYAGFVASIELCTQICQRLGWNVVRVYGQGWTVFSSDGEVIKEDPLKYWMNAEGKVAFVGHPESGGMGLSLTEAFMEVFYSNDFKPENRIQAKNRCDRPGQTRVVNIVDLLHLGTDRKVLDVLEANHRLEQMTMGEIDEALA